MAQHHAATGHGDGRPGHGTEDHGDHHIIPIPVYMRVFGALMILLVLTVGAATQDFGPLNLPIALLIAFTKMIVIVLYFMHVKFSSRLVQIFAGAALFWLAILFVLTLCDYWTRDWLPQLGK